MIAGSNVQTNVAGKRPPEGAVTGQKSVIQQTKNEPVVGRNIFHRAGPCKGADPTPWLWTGGTREVRTQRKTADPGRHGRFAAVDGWVYTRPCKTEIRRRFTSCTQNPLFSYQIQRNVHSYGSFF